MDRVDQLRAARNSPHVTFTEYIKLRAKCKDLVLVFEGKQCPSVYVGWLQQVIRSCVYVGGQIIARSKRNVLALRDLILNNPQTAHDKNLYFVDRDYDVEPTPESLPDVYVTRGYSIENEVVSWAAVSSYMRAYFDVADSDDQEALFDTEKVFQTAFQAYLTESRELHRVVYICRTKGIDCYPGDSVFTYIQVDWTSGAVHRSYTGVEELFEILKVDIAARSGLAAFLAADDGFKDLDPVKDWRGKFHFSFLRGFLIYLRDARTGGSAPFKRRAKLTADPSHPSLMGLLGSLSACPETLALFVTGHIANTGAQLGR